MLRPPRVPRRARVVERRDRAVVEARGTRDRAAAASSCGARDQPQHPHRVVRRRAPQRVVEAAEHGRAPRRASSTRDRWRALRGGRDASGSGAGERRRRVIAWHAPTSARERGEVDVAAGDDRDDFAGAGAAAQRRGDRAAGRAFGDDVRALGDELHAAARPRRARRRSSRRAARAAATSCRAPICRRRRRRTRPSSRRRRPAGPAASEAASGAAVSGSAAKTCVPRLAARATAAAMPGEQTAAAERRDDRIDVRQILENLERRPCRCRR